MQTPHIPDHASLEDALSKGYPVEVCRWCYEMGLRPLIKAHSKSFPPEMIAKQVGLPTKPVLVALLSWVFGHPPLGRLFVENLPARSRALLQVLAWTPSANLAAVEAQLGFEIVDQVPNPTVRRYQPYEVAADYRLAFLVNERGDSWYYYSPDLKAQKKDFALMIPPIIRKAIKGCLPYPAGYELTPAESLPTPGSSRYTCEDAVLHDLRVAAAFVTQGQAKFTKSERVTMGSVKVLGALLKGGEFFPDSKNSELAVVRTRLLANALASADRKAIEAMLNAPGEPAPLKELLARVLRDHILLHEELLPHLPLSRNRWLDYSPAQVQRLPAFFRAIPTDLWVSCSNIETFHRLRELTPTVFETVSAPLHAKVVTEASSWRFTGLNTASVSWDLVSFPLLKGFAFFLAALGLAEIEYDLPSHPDYRTPGEAYLTPFDGLRLVRLTPMGAYVLGSAQSLELKCNLPARSMVALDPVRLMATCDQPDPLTGMALSKLFEEIAPGCHLLTAKSLLGGCKHRDDLEERIQIFRKSIAASPPPNWELFFAKIRSRIAPLSLETGYVVLKVAGDEDLRRLLASEPTLRELVLKVEGMRIAVQRADLKRLGKRLEHFGYLCPVSSLIEAAAWDDHF
jgi:hypothetical protein